MEAVLVTRTSDSTTADLRLEVTLAGKTSGQRQAVETVPASEWSRAPPQGSHPGVAQQSTNPVDLSYKPHALPGFSAFGTDETNEFATFVTGRETFLSSQDLREELENDLRSFAEKSDHTEGFMLTSPLSDGFAGFTSTFVEHLVRDEFSKSTIFTTLTLSDALDWKRLDTERSQGQRLLNEALGLTSLEEFSNLCLPIQPPATKLVGNHPYLRDDLEGSQVYAQLLNQHLQSANSELREPDGLTQIVQQLNWRGDNKIASLSGISPMLPAEDYPEGVEGLNKLRSSWYDWSTLPDREGKRSKKLQDEETPFAQYSIVRGFEFEESQRLGPILESTTRLKEPLSQWVSLPDPYPILPSALPVYRGLLPDGRPLRLSQPFLSNPSTSAGLFGLDVDTRYPLPSTYLVQPRSIPILTTVSTKPSTKYWIKSLSKRVKEMVRVKSSGLREYEEGEFGVGREGILECLERLETIYDNYGGNEGEGGGGDQDVDKDEDENWDDTEDTWDL